MRSQRLAPRLAGSAVDVARAVCGVQAQDAGAGVLSIGVRAEGLTAADVGPGLVRTWAWRSTLHLLAEDDVPWVLALTGGLPVPAARWRQLGLDDEVYARARSVLAELEGPVARPALRERLAAAGVDASGQRLPHLVLRAAREGLVCLDFDGAVMPLRVGGPPPRDEALAELGRRYLDAFGPAEVADLRTWSGLPAADVKAAWAARPGGPDGAGDLKGPGGSSRPKGPGGSGGPKGPGGSGGPKGPGGSDDPAGPVVRFLPAFDTYLLGYRQRPVAPEHAKRVWPGGGWIHPVVLVDGVAAATWRRDGDVVEVDPFGALPPLDDELEHLGSFLGRRLRLAAA